MSNGACVDKTKSVVIADAGPVIHLDELGVLELLADFGKVIIPETVRLEVERHRPMALKSAGDWFVRQLPRQHSVVVSALTPLYSLHAIPNQTTLHVRPVLLKEVIADVEAYAP